MRRLALLGRLALAALAPAPAHAHPASPFPKLIALPVGLQPEGIAIKRTRPSTSARSPPARSIAATCAPGQGAPLVPAHEGRAAIGLKVHHKQLWVAGGPTGKAFVYDARTGADVAEYVLATGTPFINDVALGRARPSSRTRAPPRSSPSPLRGGPVRRIALAGDFVQTGDADRHQPQRHRRRGPAHARSSCRSNTGRLFAADTRTRRRARDRPRRRRRAQRRRPPAARPHAVRRPEPPEPDRGHPPLARPGAGQVVRDDHRPGVRRADDDRRATAAPLRGQRALRHDRSAAGEVQLVRVP